MKTKSTPQRTMRKVKLLNDPPFHAVRRFSQVTNTTIAAQNQRLSVLVNLGDWLQNWVTADHEEPNFKRASMKIVMYSSGPFAFKPFMGLALIGATFTDSNFLDQVTPSMFNTAYALKPYTVVDLGRLREAKCTGSNLWTLTVTLNVKHWLNRYIERNPEETDADATMNLIGLTSQNASQSVEIYCRLDYDYLKKAKQASLRTFVRDS